MGGTEVVLEGLDNVAFDVLFLLQRKKGASDYLSILVISQAFRLCRLPFGLHLASEAKAIASYERSHECQASSQHSPPNKTIYIICFLNSKSSEESAITSCRLRS